MTPPRPTVILHNAVSLDGWLDGFAIDLGLYYEVAGSFGADVILAGSTTILEAFSSEPDALEQAEPEADDAVQAPPRPILAVVDSRGRISEWPRLSRQPYWRQAMALCALSTPGEYLSRLRRDGIEVISAGEQKVDLAAALTQLLLGHGARIVRVDSGGRLNAALLRAGLVDRLSLLVHPVVAGPSRAHRLVETDGPEPIPHVPFGAPSVTTLRAGIVWLDFPVEREPAG